jgi:glycogen debranching enzyme
VIELTNPDLHIESRTIQKETLGIRWERIVDGGGLFVAEALTFRNYGFEPVELPIEFTFRSSFEPLFAVRGLLGMKLGKIRPSHWHNGILTLTYDGADGVTRSLAIHFSPAPDSTEGGTARFRLDLKSEEEKPIRITLCVADGTGKEGIVERKPPRINPEGMERSLRGCAAEWLSHATTVASDSPLLNEVMQRSLRDLYILKNSLGGHEFFAAGVPWFVTLFGRDSLIASLESLAYNPGLAESTLRIMAGYQGRKIDDWRDEEPGKIMHELRIGELAHLNEIPQTPYYGTIDATPLFLILIARHAAWTGTLRVFNELREAVEAALAWIARYGDHDGDGYIEYRSLSEKGLINQGWKDSGDAIVNADGSLAQPPIALVEVQAYVYLAKISLAELYERAGEPEYAQRLRREAEALRCRFNRDFWLDDKGYYALALQAENKPAAVISSNPGHALWTGIADKDKAGATAARLMAEDMFSGWGIRTLSAEERRYNPIGYHLGTVWPHDNAIIAAGLRRYGFDREACRIFSGIVEAAPYFEHHRLPEVFAGFSRSAYGVPVRYPVACHPQAWAAGAVPYLVETALGLMPEAFEQRLRIMRPVLPDFVRCLELQQIRVGKCRADVRFERNPDGVIKTTVLRVEGTLEVIIETSGTQGNGSSEEEHYEVNN